MRKVSDAVLGLPAASLATPAGTVTVTSPAASASGATVTVCRVPSLRLAERTGAPFETESSDISKPVTGSLNATVDVELAGYRRLRGARHRRRRAHGVRRRDRDRRAEGLSEASLGTPFASSTAPAGRRTVTSPPAAGATTAV